MSVQLQRLADNDRRFDEYSDETWGFRPAPGQDPCEVHDGHWLYTAPGWKWDGDPYADLHQIHEWTVKDVLAEVPNVVPCRCQGCVTITYKGDFQTGDQEA